MRIVNVARIVAMLEVLSVIASAQAMAEEKVRADRTPLTFRDSGLYCNIGFVHGRDPAEDGVTNLLPAERAVQPDTPWDFYVVQCNENTPGPDTASMLREMARNGKKVILRAAVGRMHEKPDVDEMEQWLVTLFENVDPDWLYAVTLDEEQVYWNGWADALTRLYYRVKARWPDLPVYQWWTPMIAPSVRDKRGWVALPADGWVMDLYGLRGYEFEKKMLKFLETGKPLVHIAWASPTWIFYDREGYMEEDWWEKAGRAVFDEQLRICREYNVPVAYFCCQPSGEKDGKRYPIRWGWHAVDPVVRRWFLELEALVCNFDYLPEEEIGFRRPTARKYEWVYVSPPVEVKFSLDQKERKRFSWRTSFPDVKSEPGEHEFACTYENAYVRVFYVLEESARDLLQGRFAVASVDKRSVSVPIVLRVVPLKPVADWEVSIGLTAQKSLGGRAGVAFSADGKTWSEELTTDPEATRQTLSIDATLIQAVRGTAPFWLKVILEGGAGVKTNAASRLSSLELSASLEPTGRPD